MAIATTTATTTTTTTATTTTSAADSRPGLFAVPAPIRELFKLFPLAVYQPDTLPARAPDCASSRPRLFVFASESDALKGRPSFNPSCLKWQTFLRIAGVSVELVPSSNHASPSGALPFLLPPSSSQSNAQPPTPLTSDNIAKYARDQTSFNVPQDPTSRVEAYRALIAQNIRPAWLYTLYLLPANATLLKNLYLPSSVLLRLPLRTTLSAAASAEILKTTRRPHISPEQLLIDAEAAFRSLSTLLDDKDWFFGTSSPGLFDAEVFAYTYLILNKSLGWNDDALANCVSKFENLAGHQKRLYKLGWGKK